MGDTIKPNEDFYGNLGKSEIEVDTSPTGSLNDLEAATQVNTQLVDLPIDRPKSPILSPRFLLSLTAILIAGGTIFAADYFNNPTTIAERTTAVSSNSVENNNSIIWLISGVGLVLILGIVFVLVRQEVNKKE